jgi:phosphatidylserine/phosphatidylglycerophosphate/cardiolipin synthase-like enzyme
VGKVHVGTVGDIVIPALEKAEYSIDVCSPWISTDYARLLRSKASQGVKVRLITSENQEALQVFEHRRAERGSDSNKSWESWGWKPGMSLEDYLFQTPSGIAMIGTVAFVVLLLAIRGRSWLIALISGVFLLAAIYRFREGEYHPGVSSDVERPLPMTLMTVPSGKFHAKMYIVDQSVAYVGSANLTRASMYGKRED